MAALLLLLGCNLQPAAGELRTDREELEQRIQLPPGTSSVRWMTQAARSGRTASGRADARVYAWVSHEGNADDWLEVSLGASLPARAHWVPDAVAQVLFTPEERAGLQRSEQRASWKLGCLRFPAASIGRGEYRGETVLACEGRLYVVAAAR